MREVRIAIGFTDKTWTCVLVEVPEDPNHVLLDEEAEEQAIDIAKDMGDTSLSGAEAVFYTILQLIPAEELLDGVV